MTLTRLKQHGFQIELPEISRTGDRPIHSNTNNAASGLAVLTLWSIFVINDGIYIECGFFLDDGDVSNKSMLMENLSTKRAWCDAVSTSLDPNKPNRSTKERIIFEYVVNESYCVLGGKKNKFRLLDNLRIACLRFSIRIM